MILMNSILSNYLNVYYTDVLDISGIWGGLFIGMFPIVAKVLDVLTFIYMGVVVDRTRSRQGKARPWILFSAPLLTGCMILLFVVPKGNDNLTAIWIFVSYTIFYAVAYTMYSTAHTLMVPLSTYREDERSRLSLITNTPNMVAVSLYCGTFDRGQPQALGVCHAGSCDCIVANDSVGVFFTRERVTERSRLQEEAESEKLSLKEQFSCCMKSRQWVILMVYLILIQTVNAMFSAGTFYYCNWVLGSYNDGYTQALFYALGQAPLGIGIVLCRPICNKLGRRRAMTGGFVLAFVGVLICLLSPGNLVIVLAGQVVRTIGLIPSTFMISSMLGDALDEVEQVSKKRCDGFSSSVMNCITTLMGGIALCIFNFGISQLGYQAPTETMIPVQNDAVQKFIIFCVIGVQALCYPVIALLLTAGKRWRKAKRRT